MSDYENGDSSTPGGGEAEVAGPRWRAVAAVAVVIALLALLTVIVVNRRGDDDENDTATGTPLYLPCRP